MVADTTDGEDDVTATSLQRPSGNRRQFMKDVAKARQDATPSERTIEEDEENENDPATDPQDDDDNDDNSSVEAPDGASEGEEEDDDEEEEEEEEEEGGPAAAEEVVGQAKKKKERKAKTIPDNENEWHLVIQKNDWEGKTRASLIECKR